MKKSILFSIVLVFAVVYIGYTIVDQSNRYSESKLLKTQENLRGINQVKEALEKVG